MLFLYLGNGEKSKKDVLYDRIAKDIENGLRPLILVPEIRSHFEERELLERCGNSAGFWADVSTFSKLASDVLSFAGRPFEKLDASGRILAMKKAVSEASASLVYYRGMGSASVGMLEKLVDLYDEFEDSGVVPETLLDKEDLSKKLLDISKIFISYENVCKNAGPDQKMLLKSAADAAGESGYFKDRTVYLMGFNGFTAQELVFVKKLCAVCTVNVSLYTIKGSELYDRQLKTAEKLKRGQGGTEELFFEGDSKSAFEAFSNALLNYSAYDLPAPCGLSLYKAHDQRQESELCAALCRIYALSGHRFRDIGIVCPDPEQYTELLASFGEKYGVPVFSAEKRSVLTMLPVSAVLDILEAVVRSMDSAPFMRWLKSPYSGLERSECERLENYVVTWGINGSRWDDGWAQPESGYDGQDKPGSMEMLNYIREKAVLSATPFRDTLKNCRIGEDFVNAVRSALDACGYEKKTDDICRELESRGLGLQSSRFSQARDALKTTLGQFANIMGAEKMNRQEFLDLFKLALSQCRVSAIPPSLDSVSVSDFSRAIIENKKVFFILGARDGDFPKSTADKGLLSDSDRIALEGDGIVLVKNREEIAQRDIFDIHAVFCGAQEKLIITSPEFDVMGNQCRPSYLVNRMEEMLGGGISENASNVIEDLRFSAAAPAFEQACAMGRDRSGPFFDAFPQKSGEFDEIMYRIENPYDVIRNSSVLRKMYGDTIQLSATSVEKYSQCPFSYFMDKGLRARPVEQESFDAPKIGTLFHSIAENAVRDCMEEKGSEEELTEKYAKEFVQGLSGLSEKDERFLYAVERLKNGALVMVRNLMQEIRSSRFKPEQFELSFGNGKKLDPLVLEDSGVSAQVKGTIDRLDVMRKDGKTYFKISDYKTGKKDYMLSDILYGENLQLFIYALAAIKNAQTAMGDAKAEPAAAVYIPANFDYINLDRGGSYGISDEEITEKLNSERERKGVVINEPDITEALDGGTKGFFPKKPKKGYYLLSRDVFDMMLRKTEREVLKTAKEITSGRTAPDPMIIENKRITCDYCKFNDACFMERSGIKRRKRSYAPEKVIERLCDEENGKTN